MFKFCGILILYLGVTQSFYPIMHPMAGAYNSFWDGAVGGQGYWGELPTRKANVFNSEWDNKGFKQMYNLNSMSPFGGDRFTGFDTMVPYYSPHGASRFSYYPTKSNFLSKGELGAFSYDINEPRYQELYKQYYRFFNKNLNRIQNQLKYQETVIDLNNDQHRKNVNPDSFSYNQYFDGYDEKNTLPGAGSPFLSHKVDTFRDMSSTKGRQLTQTNKSTSNRYVDNNNIGIGNREAQKVVHKLEKRVQSMRKLINELEGKTESPKKNEQPRKLNYVIINPKDLHKVDLKPYIFDSLAPHSLIPDFNRV